MISIWQAYISGIRMAWNYKKVVFFLYGINLVIAYLIMIPLSTVMSKALDNTTAALRLLEGLDMTTFSTIYSEFGNGLSLASAVFGFGLVYLVLNTFFAGGILHLLKENIEFSLKEFLSGCTIYFKRFFKLLGISLVLLLSLIIFYVIITLLFGIFTKNAVTEFWPFILFFVKLFLIVCMLAMINMFFDYVKILIVSNDYYRIFKTLKDTMMFVMMSMRKTIGLYGLYLFTALAALVIYLYINNFYELTGPLTIFKFFVVSQLYMILKMFIRVSFFTGQFGFYTHSNTAMPGMTKEMLDEAVEYYEARNP